MRRTGALIALALAAAFPVSCNRPALPLRVAIHSAPLGFDPHLHNESLTAAVLANIYDGLTEHDDEFGIRPGLAAGWTNPDDYTWRFRIRPSVRFHDGRSLTAADVVFSLERARRHPASGLSSYLVEVETVRALDPLTVEVRTRRPFAPLLAKLAPVSVVPAGSPEVITKPVGTGTYRLARFEETVVEMVPAGRDWRGGRGLAPLTFVVEADPDERLRKLLSGDVDVAADLDEKAVRVLRGVECCREEIRPGSTVEYLQLPDSEVPFRDRRVREAVHLALDRGLFVAEAHGGLGQPVAQMAVPGVFGYAPDLSVPQRDVARARALLAEAGYSGGLDLVLEHRPGRRADVIARQLADAGIRVTPRESSWPDLYRRLRRGEVGFYFGGVASPTAESSDVLDGYVHTRDPEQGYGASNHSRYSSARADALIEAASSSFVLVRRRELLQEAMRVVMRDLHFVPVAGLYQVNGARHGVDFRARVDLKLLGREITRRRALAGGFWK